MGKLFRRKDRGLTWYADYYDRNGERQKTSTKTADREVARARLRDLELQTTDRGAHQTEALNDALDYFTNVVHTASPAGTVRCYRQKACHVSAGLGRESVDGLTREAVDRYVAARLKAGAHTHTVHKELVVLRGALKSAKERGTFHGSLEVVPPFSAGYEPRRVWITPEQFARLAEHLVAPPRNNAKPASLAKREREKARRILYCMLIAFASPRVGELAAMDWAEHVDLARNVVQIPKGKTVWRPIAIHPLLRVWLEACRKPSGLVVGRWGNVGRDLPLACKRAGVPRVTPNDLRRTFSSWLKQAGVDSMTVARMLGHKSTRMVDLVYGHLDEATLAAAIGRMPGGAPAGTPGTNRRPRGGGSRGSGGQNRGDAGGTTKGTNRVIRGANRQARVSGSVANSVEESAISETSLVPRAGIEPAARGFSVLYDLAETIENHEGKLKLVG